jgi:DNA-binding NtrC family response regulator
MARARKTKSLPRDLFDATTTPIYVLDDERRLVFMNPAWEEWLGRPAADLIGQVCRYGSADAETPDGVANSLGPPEEAFLGHTTEGIVQPGDAASRRRVRFIPLPGADHGRSSVLAVGEPGSVDLVGPASEYEEHTSLDLHARLIAWRDVHRRDHLLHVLVGDSPRARQLRNQFSVAGNCAASVTLSGPPGSGRQHLARGIHLARQPAGSFAPLSCSMLNAELLLSTVGAFSASLTADAPGTLLLRDVDQLEAAVQRLLARRLDSESGRLRILATSRRPLSNLADDGNIHRELACTLGTLAIEIPSLRERREDIPLIAQSVLETCNLDNGKQLSGFEPEALDGLVGHTWNGEMSELARSVRKAHAAAGGPLVRRTDLPDRIRLTLDARRRPKMEFQPVRLEEVLQQTEIGLIEQALRAAKNNKARAARYLGITRPRLYRRMVSLGLIDETTTESEATDDDLPAE